MEKETKFCSFCSRKLEDIIFSGIDGCICPECLALGNKYIEQSLSNINKVPLKEIPKPIEIKKFLDQYIIGQDRVKEKVAVAVYNHYKRINCNVVDDVEIEKSNLCLLGPTGSGKSTTLYATLAEVSDITKHVITLEDPVERRMPGICQVQMNNRAGMTFAAALRSVLRADPDIVMVGEIRDGETAKIAVESALTGHMVFSTLHTNDSLNTIERLLDMEVERYLLASALSGIVSQKLARKLCDKCKKLRPTTNYEKNLFI